MKFKSDIDVDFGNREDAIRLLNVTPAGIIRDDKLIRHNTGVYPTEIPRNPFTGIASIDYRAAEDRGYAKLDFLNVSLYTQIKNEQHLTTLMAQEPVWDLLQDRDFCSLLIHIGNHYDTLMKMPEPVDTIPRLAMFLAIIRPGKRHLIGKSWAEVAQTIWTATEGYSFKRSHSVAYSHLVVVHMNLICEQISQEYS
jgi:DNA polymerase III alpha subunit